MRTYVPDSHTYTQRARPGVRFPIVLELPLGERSAIEIYASMRERYGRVVLLESGKAGRYSYVARADGDRFLSSGRMITLPDGSSHDGDPFDALRRLVRAEAVVRNDLLHGFSGGLVGYLAYDMARHIERLPDHTLADPPIPDCELYCVETFCEVDHDEGMLRLVTATRCGDDPHESYRAAIERIDELAVVIGEPTAIAAGVATTIAADTPSRTPSTRVENASISDDVDGVAASLTPEQFHAIVRRAREYIRAGDIFQVNLSVRFATPFEGDQLALYRELRAINPAPYMALLELPELSIVSASPELLVRIHDGVVETRPIAGTRPRGATQEEDERNARKLAENEKERAEHLMLVDLERNDLGRVCRYGSVKVDEFMGIERYSHVIHIVSHVRGELAEGRDTIDAIRACFPGGTITGAPKVRSMEIIEELEPHRRGVYTGSIGWIGFNANAELNIAIRTIVVVDGIAYAQAGAGIVADSVPEHEYRESVRKAEAALEALERTKAHAS